MAFGMSAASAALVGSIAAPVVGGLIGGMGGGGGGGSSPSGSTTSTASNSPWDAIQPYLVGGSRGRPKLGADGNPIFDANGQPVMEGAGPGLADEAARLYGTTGMGADQSAFNQRNQDWLRQFSGDDTLNQSIWNNGALANQGNWDTNITPASNVSPNLSNLQSARTAQGPLDPTQSMQRLLSGQPDNPYLASMASGLTGLSNQNLLQNIMPAIGQGATMAGQYGGSRQGIAQGVAAGNAQTGLNNSIAGLYGNAYAQAQQNMMGTANNLNAQAGQNSQFNSGLDLQGQQFNSNLQLQNNSQRMQEQQNNLNNRVTGSNLINSGMNAQQNLMGAFNNSADYTRNQPWADLSRYQSVIQPLAGMGNTQTQNNPYFTNTAGNVLGGMSAGLGIGQKIGGMFGSGSASNVNNPMWDAYSGFDNPANYG